MLTKRLNYIVNAIPRCAVLADVGCDHGYVGIEALKRRLTERVVFIDVSSACLQKARTNCPAGLDDNASFVCQDGLGKTKCDVAVICGMGGLEILSILNDAERLPEAVVLQPMRNIVDTRKYVAEHYEITLDTVIYDDKFYSVIVGENLGQKTGKLDELQTEFGLTNMENPTEDFVTYLRYEQTKLTKILDGCNAEEVSARLDKVNKALEQIRRKI